MSWRERLRVWLRALRHYVELPERLAPHEVDEARETGIVWLRWKQLSAPSEDRMLEFFMAYEALELLALLARVDYNAWLRTIEHVWPRAVKNCKHALYPQHFKLGVAVHIARSGEVSKWAEHAFLLGAEGEDQSEDYAHTRAELDATPLARRARSTQIPVRLVLIDGEDQLDNLSRLLFEAVQLAALQVARRAVYASCPRQFKSMFRLVDVHANGRNDTERYILYARELTTMGVRMPTVCLMAMEQLAIAPLYSLITSLHRLIATPTKHKSVPVERVVVDLDAPRQTLDGIFSSILHSKFLREVVLAIDEFDNEEEQEDVREANHKRLMQWLALSVFGRYGCPSLDKISLDMAWFQVSDVLALERAMHKADPFTGLFVDAKRVDGGSEVVAEASKFQLTHPSAADVPVTARVVWFEPPLKSLRILSMAGPLVSVLLPGWGRAWVLRSEVTIREMPKRELCASLKPRSLRHIELRADDEAIVLQLLGVVGVGARALTITWQMDLLLLSTTWVRSVCLVCQDLKDIYLDKISADALDELARCYGDGTCHASRLVLDAVGVGSNPSRFHIFFKSLADTDHGLYRHLRELTIKICCPTTVSRQRRLLSRVIKTVKINRTLSNLELVLQCSNPDEREIARRAINVSHTMMDRFNGTNVSVYVAPLRTKKKLAFLSTIQDSKQSCRGALDASVVGLIFQYAAKCMKRRVLVTVE